MKTLVVYYSHDGSTKLIAETIAKELKVDIEIIKPKKKIDASRAKIVRWGLQQLLTHPKPEIEQLVHNPMEYDEIIIGTPVWSYTYSPPIRTFIEDNSIKGKRVALFCCHGGQKARTLNHMKKDLSENTFVGEIDFFEPIKNETEKNIGKAIKWAKTLK